MPKSIQIDNDAYERIEQVRRADETISEVIRRFVKAPKSVEEVLQALREADISDETLDAIDESVTHRRRTPRRRKA